MPSHKHHLLGQRHRGGHRAQTKMTTEIYCEHPRKRTKDKHQPGQGAPKKTSCQLLSATCCPEGPDVPTDTELLTHCGSA